MFPWNQLKNCRAEHNKHCSVSHFFLLLRKELCLLCLSLHFFAILFNLGEVGTRWYPLNQNHKPSFAKWYICKFYVVCLSHKCFLQPADSWKSHLYFWSFLNFWTILDIHHSSCASSVCNEISVRFAKGFPASPATYFILMGYYSSRSAGLSFFITSSCQTLYHLVIIQS